MRRIWLAGVSLVALFAGVAPADAAAKPRLQITSLASHHGARIGPHERFRITGVVRNNWRASSPALISATLRLGNKTRFVLGAGSVAHVPGHRSRKFTIAATGPRRGAGAQPRRFVLAACVRPRRGGGWPCARLKRSVVVLAPARGGGGPPPGDGGGGGGAYSAGARWAGDRL